MWGKNSLTKLLKYVLLTELKLCVEPFNNLNADGDISSLFESFPHMIKLIAMGDKPKIVKACLFLLGQLIYLIENRSDIILLLGTLAPYLNEVYIEHYNSLLERRLLHKRGDFQQIRNESVNTGRIRFNYEQFSNLFELNDNDGDCDTQSTKFRKNERSTATEKTRESEVRTQVLRFRQGGKVHELVKYLSRKWFIPLIENYGKIDVKTQYDSIFNNFRPLERDQNIFLLNELDKLKSYVQTVIKKEDSAKLSEENPQAQEQEQMSFLDYFLLKQTVKKTLKPVHTVLAMRGYPRIHEKFYIDPAGKTLPNLKADIIADIKLALLRYSLDEDLAIVDFKNICRCAPIGMIEYIKVDNNPQAQKLKRAKHSFQYALGCVPDKPTCERIIGEIAYDSKYKFPFTESDTVSNEDDDDETI